MLSGLPHTPVTSLVKYPPPRACRRCNQNCVENEEYSLLTCNDYDEPRSKLLLLFQELVPKFQNLALREKVLVMTSNEHLGLIKKVATFRKNAFKLREQSLSC